MFYPLHIRIVSIPHLIKSFSIVFYFIAEGTGEDGTGNAYDRIVYDARLGLAVEGMQEGLSLEQLWKVV